MPFMSVSVLGPQHVVVTNRDSMISYLQKAILLCYSFVSCSNLRLFCSGSLLACLAKSSVSDEQKHSLGTWSGPANVPLYFSHVNHIHDSRFAVVVVQYTILKLSKYCLCILSLNAESKSNVSGKSDHVAYAMIFSLLANEDAMLSSEIVKG